MHLWRVQGLLQVVIQDSAKRRFAIELWLANRGLLFILYAIATITITIKLLNHEISNHFLAVFVSC
jgi:hypothetical protein